MKKISFSGLKKVMSPKEMKNITGGSDGSCAAIGLEVNGERQCISKTDGKVLDYVEIPYVPLFLGIYVDNQRIPGRHNRLVKCPEGVLLCSAETDTIFLYSQKGSLTPKLYKTPSVTSTDPMKYLKNCLDRGPYQFIEIVTVREGYEYPGIFPVTH